MNAFCLWILSSQPAPCFCSKSVLTAQNVEFVRNSDTSLLILLAWARNAPFWHIRSLGWYLNSRQWTVSFFKDSHETQIALNFAFINILPHIWELFTKKSVVFWSVTQFLCGSVFIEAPENWSLGLILFDSHLNFTLVVFHIDIAIICLSFRL